MVGYSRKEWGIRPFRWSESWGYEVLAVLAGFVWGDAHAVASGGRVAGTCGGGNWTQAVTWDADGQPHVLPHSHPAVQRSFAYDLNTHGWVVGFQLGFQASVATLWIDGTPYELGQFLQPGPVVEIHSAVDVNDAGQILCLGKVRGVDRAFRLDPI